MLHYRMEGNEYALVDENDNIHWAGEEIAIGFSYEPDEEIPGTLHKHGSPESVNKWAEITRKKFIESDQIAAPEWYIRHGLPFYEGLGQEMADNIVVVSGKMPIEELNKMIEISGYVGVWYRKMLEKEAA